MNSDDELARLFEAERRERAEPDDEKRGFTRLSGALASSAAPMAVSTSPLGLGLSALWKWSAGTGAIVFIAGGAALSRTPSHAPEPARATTASATHGVRGAENAAPELRRPEQANPPAPFENEPSHAENDAGHGDRDAAFTEELRLVKLAKQEIDGGRIHLAEVWLAEHARRFPRGVFHTERDALRVLVACTSDPAAGKSRAEDFVKENPRSPLVDRISRACALGEAPNEKFGK
jgi:hypothetical protein